MSCTTVTDCVLIGFDGRIHENYLGDISNAAGDLHGLRKEDTVVLPDIREIRCTIQFDAGTFPVEDLFQIDFKHSTTSMQP